MEVGPYTVHIPQALLDDLHARLTHTRWPDEIPATGWQYGAELKYMMDLVDYWRTRFDWRAQERAINAFSHFRAIVDGVGIHFIHEKGRGASPDSDHHHPRMARLLLSSGLCDDVEASPAPGAAVVVSGGCVPGPPIREADNGRAAAE
jgi:Epoxide hydrolase N terminus